MKYIQIKDKNNKINNWVIEDEEWNTYKIFCNGFITEVQKNACCEIDGKYFCDLIINPFSDFISDIKSPSQTEDLDEFLEKKSKCKKCIKKNKDGYCSINGLLIKDIKYSDCWFYNDYLDFNIEIDNEEEN